MTECLPGLLYLLATLRHRALRRRHAERALRHITSKSRALSVARFIP